jgi:hypothetical protein
LVHVSNCRILIFEEHMLKRAIKTFITGLAATMLQPVFAKPIEQDAKALPTGRPCPAALDDVANCYTGRDPNGAWYLAAVPKVWNSILVVHAHGGPRLGEPKQDDPDEDLDRFAALVREGYAWIGSTYRRGGYGVRMAAEDVDNSRALFWANFTKPRLTILHGQSYGGNVAAKLAELRSVSASGEKLYDGVLLTNSVLLGGTRAYGFRANLRAVYQYFCRNHPRADEFQYPVWQGLPQEGSMSRDELESRVNACLGLNVPVSMRTPDQLRKLSSISGVTGIAEKDLIRHLEWGTFTFQDLIHRRLEGRNPFDNISVIYRGSSDDAKLNKGVERFAADPRAVRKLAYDSDLSGLIGVPTIAIHWARDPIAPPSGDRDYQAKVIAQGNDRLFLSIWTSTGTHSRLESPDLLSGLEALVASAEQGQVINLDRVRDMCRTIAVRMAQKCTMMP